MPEQLRMFGLEPESIVAPQEILRTITVDFGDPFDVPAAIAVCPLCKGRLRVTDYAPTRKERHRGGFELECEHQRSRIVKHTKPDKETRRKVRDWMRLWVEIE